ncbi:uncharacterized protein LOC128310427 [Anopheles moucheti]|uniref:uncharacterized protein LOC128310427 n=1 Tax=Anopheles moucheti TaxID=186751 RepID=UPI0022F0B442|nr:uncharacterized protein LOC128310427 [Anopheles moucheti]
MDGTTPTLSALMQFLIFNYYTPYYSFCTVGRDFLSDLAVSRILLSVNDRFDSNLLLAIDNGCQAFVVDEPGIERFLHLYIPVHDVARQRSLDKSLILLITQQNQTLVFDRLRTMDVFRELPNVLLIVYDEQKLPTNLYTTAVSSTDVLDRKVNITLKQLPIEWNNWRNFTFFPDKTSDLKGYVLRTSVVNYLPFTSYEVLVCMTLANEAGNAFDSVTGKRSMWLDGTELQMLVSFCERRNCNILVSPEDEDMWGDVYPNGTGNGLMGSVVQRRTDIAFGAFYLWLAPYNFSTYTATISRSMLTMLVPKPKVLPFWRTPFLTFSLPLWITVLVTLLAGILATWFAGTVRHRLLLHSVDTDRAAIDLIAEQLTLSDSVLMMVGFFVAQSSSIRNDLWSCVFLFASLLLAGFMVSNLYSAGLASIMTVPQYEKSIDTVKDFAASGMPWYGPTPYCLDEIWNASEPHLQQIIKTFSSVGPEEMKRLAHVGGGGFTIEQAQHGNFAPNNFLDRESSTTFQPLKDYIYTQNCAALITNTNPLLSNLNEYILRVQQSGLLYHLGTQTAIRYLPTDVMQNIEQSRIHQHNEGAVTLEIGHFLGAFFILCYGLLCAGIVFIGEIWGTVIIQRMNEMIIEKGTNLSSAHDMDGTTPTLSALMQFLIFNYYTPYYSFCTVGRDFLSDLAVSRILLSVNDRFDSNLLLAIDNGCQAFVVDEPGIERFLHLYIPVHDVARQRSLDKSLILLITQQNQTLVFDRLRTMDVFRELPNVLLIVYDEQELPTNLYTTAVSITDVLDRKVNITLKQLPIEWNNWRNFTFFPDKTSDLKGYVLRTSVVNYLPFTSYEVLVCMTLANEAGNAFDSVTGKRSMWLDGTELQMLVSFCERRNCNILASPEDEDMWGDVYPNGTGNGLMGSVVQRRTDIAFGAFYLWLAPYNFSTYTASISRSGVTVLVPKPKVLPFWRTPFLTFSVPLWIAVFVTLLAGIVATWFAGTVRHRLLLHSVDTDRGPIDLIAEQLTLSDSVLMMVGFFVAQSSSIRNDLWSCVFLFASLLLAGFMVSNLYSAGLASIMTVPQYEKSIDTVKDFAASGMPWYGPTPYCLDEIWNASEPHLQQIIKTFSSVGPEGMKRLAHVGGSGFIIEQAQHGNFAPNNFLDRESSTTFQPLKDYIYTQNCAALITNTNPLLSNLNEYILRVQQSGLLYHLGTQTAIRYLPTDVMQNIEQSRIHQHNEGAVTLEIGHFLGAFFILCYGLLCAGIVFIGEIWGTVIIQRMNEMIM